MTTIVKAESPAAFLALVPHLLDYEPRNSLVFVTFAGKQSQAVLRINLPTSTDETVLKRIATQALGTLCKVPGIDAFLPVVYCDDAFGDDAPYRTLVNIVLARVRSMGFEVRGAFCRAADGWASYLDDAIAPGGHPLSELVTPERLPEPAAQLVPIPDAGPVARDAMRAEIRRLRALVDDDDASREFEPLDDVTVFIDDALDWDTEERKQYGALLLMLLQGPPLRDHTMVQWSSSLAFGDRFWEDGPELADRILGHGARPDRDRTDRGIDLLGHLLSLAYEEFRPAPLCMLAWLHWTQGRSNVAGAHVAEARAIDPVYGMAELLESILRSGLLPEWLFESQNR